MAQMSCLLTELLREKLFAIEQTAKMLLSLSVTCVFRYPRETSDQVMIVS